MKQLFMALFFGVTTFFSFAQPGGFSTSTGATAQAPKVTLGEVKKNPATAVKNQSATGTCWSFSTTSLVESQAMKNNLGEFDLSEMFTVRNIYLEKAKNYVLRQGRAQFSEGGLGHDQVRAIALYGAMPESVYSGLTPGKQQHDHQRLIVDLKNYLDSVIRKLPLAENWMPGFTNLLDAALGKPPAEFEFRGKKYTAQSFAKNVLHFNAGDYVTITSFTHHPFYEPFILEVPDNYSNGAYINVPLDEMIQLTKDAINSGYTVMWDADVSNSGFMQGAGIAGLYDTSINAVKRANKNKFRAARDRASATASDMEQSRQQSSGTGTDKKEPVEAKEELLWDADLRQALFENLTTQDDHLMHITGMGKSANGKQFFIVKNSWGKIGPDNGYISVSESYFAINTISLVVPRAALSKQMLDKLKIK